MRIYIVLLCFACLVAFNSCASTSDQDNAVQLDKQLAFDLHEIILSAKDNLTLQIIADRLATYHEEYMASGLSSELSLARFQKVITTSIDELLSKNEEATMALKATPCYDALVSEVDAAQEEHFVCGAEAFLDPGAQFGCFAELIVEVGNAYKSFDDCMCTRYELRC